MANGLNALIPMSGRPLDLANSLNAGAKFSNALAGNSASGASVYGTPIYGEDENGNQVLGVIGKDGSFRKLDTGGITPTPGVQWQDFGSYKQPMGRGGSPVGPAVPVTGAPPQGYVPPQQPRAGVGAEGGYMPGTSPSEVAEEGARGRARGENVDLYESMKSKLPGLYQTVQQLETLSNKATYTTAGRALDFAYKEAGVAPRESAVARSEYIAIVDNQILPLLRDTFGAQFTEREGDTLKSTLGNPDMSPQEKQAVLRSFIAQKVRDIEALGSRIDQPGASMPPIEVPQGGPRIQNGATATNPETGERIIFQNGQWVPMR